MRPHPYSPRTALRRAVFLPFILFGIARATADSVIAPNSMATADGQLGSGLLRAENLRAQSIYSSVHFPPDIGLLITELRYRPDYFYGRPFTTTVANIRFNLSTTTRNPESPSPNFASNVGSDDTVVFSGALSISSQFLGPANGPKEFDIIVPLATPFLYNPAAGHLLVDVRNFSGAPDASAVGGRGDPNDGGARVGGALGSATGGADNGVEALQIIYIPTNQPPPPPPPPPRLVRGPYLQNATKTNIVVRWRTSAPTNSVVRFGLADGALTWGVTNLAFTSNHSVLLTNLAPDTKYFYAIGATETNWAGGTDYLFQTLTATNRPLRIWTMGDFGTTGLYGDGALAVRDAYRSFTGSRYTDAWIMLGDNAYQNGTDEDFQRALFDVYPAQLRQMPVWSTIGNHETYGADTNGYIAYYDIFAHPEAGEAGGVPSGTTRYYSFDFGNVHFVCLDSEISERTPDGAMATWLREDLMANTNQWLIAYFHSPPYSKGSHNSDDDTDSAGRLRDMRQVFVPILESFGVDLVLCGHSHIYERSMLIHGHYGKSWTFSDEMKVDDGDGRPAGDGAYVKTTYAPDYAEGTVYVVAGSGGFATYRTGVLHPVMVASILETGSLVLDVDGNRLDATFLRGTGAIDDSFTIIKETGTPRPSIESVVVEGGTVTLRFRTVAGHQYRVEHATQIESPEWEPVSGVLNADSDLISWSGPAPATGNHFYRIQLVDP